MRRRAAIGLAAATAALAAGAAAGPSLPRTAILWTPLLGLCLFIVGRILRPYMSWKLIATMMILGGAGLAFVSAAPAWIKARALARLNPETVKFQIRSSLYDLSVTSFRNHTPRTVQNQGGLALFADRYLLVDGSGDLFVFRPSLDAASLEIKTLAYHVPINIGEFSSAAGTTVNVKLFRVADVIAQEHNEIHRVFVTHHYWKASEGCWVLRVSSLQGSIEDFLADHPTMQWKTVFESSPCIPLTAPDRPPLFTGLENGGRMAWLTENRLLVTVGDHGMDGWATTVRAAQDKAYSYGRILSVNLDDLSTEIYSLGHRNPQGLAVTAAGQVWSTEHGPEGGDELNLIDKGGNYGWPLVSYGTEYGSHSWPLAPKPGRHDDSIRPFYSWVPSIGVSSLLEMTSPRFEHWQDDLIVSSLRAKSIWRLRIREGRVVMAEIIPFGERIREVVQGHRGELVVWSDERNIYFIEPAGAERSLSGQSIYRVCATCHVALAGGTAAIGPSLRGIGGRAVASERDFEYSPAMRALGGNWTMNRLEAFLADSRAFVPGSSMTFSGIPDAESRRALIEYLAAPDSRLDKAPPQPE